MEGESINHVLFSCTLARQIWAISGFPSPAGGFDENSLFVNVSYLLRVWKEQCWEKEITRVFPWILWYLWKNRNCLLFEGIIYDGEQVCEKAREAVELWYLTHDLQNREEGGSKMETGRRNNVWKALPWSFVKCNIGVVWSKKTKVAGASWVLRDHYGVVLLHSRRSFGSVGSKNEVFFLSVVWSMESMVSQGRI